MAEPILENIDVAAESVKAAYDILMSSAPKRIVRDDGGAGEVRTMNADELIAYSNTAMDAAVRLVLATDYLQTGI